PSPGRHVGCPDHIPARTPATSRLQLYNGLFRKCFAGSPIQLPFDAQDTAGNLGGGALARPWHWRKRRDLHGFRRSSAPVLAGAGPESNCDSLLVGEANAKSSPEHSGVFLSHV